MSLNFNGTNISKVTYNGVDLSKIIFNGTTIFTKEKSIYNYPSNYEFLGMLGNGYCFYDTTNKYVISKEGNISQSISMSIDSQYFDYRDDLVAYLDNCLYIADYNTFESDLNSFFIDVISKDKISDILSTYRVYPFRDSSTLYNIFNDHYIAISDYSINNMYCDLIYADYFNNQLLLKFIIELSYNDADYGSTDKYETILVKCDIHNSFNFIDHRFLYNEYVDNSEEYYQMSQYYNPYNNTLYYCGYDTNDESYWGYLSEYERGWSFFDNAKFSVYNTSIIVNCSNRYKNGTEINGIIDIQVFKDTGSSTTSTIVTSTMTSSDYPELVSSGRNKIVLFYNGTDIYLINRTLRVITTLELDTNTLKIGV